ncbi:thiamine pyrophosphate-dependent enzyme [Nocardioides sp. LS1]|uniref:thiamine pyrophosphate-dependent enzyme n=1 Tax=Nocardioides sp. LS1 TaxID=1027620 RepID=UPI000F61668C|nr:thiamine pyrophosphate-dependent enzyme [Nocardioides sp. LS1]GCD88417.1 putative pyruvate dehydrogenase [Nocardioides sp. LS1]
MTTVAELLIEALAEHGVTQVWGVVGDALNPVTDAIRREDRIEWVGVRHEEVAAFAASAQAQLTDRLAVCMGTVGPGAIHLLNGLYDAKKSHAPVLAICGQVPREEMGSDFFQEVDNDALFADVSVFCKTVTSIDQLPGLIEQAGNAALQARGVAVLTLPGDVGGLDLPKDTAVPRFVAERPDQQPGPEALRAAADAINAGERVTLLVGQGARHARAEVLQLADRLAAPMVLTLKAKEGLEHDNPFEVGQSGLIGNHASKIAFDGCDVLVLVGTDFPYKDFLPTGKVVVQLDVRGTHIGRRTPVDHPLVGDARLGLAALLPLLDARTDRTLLDKARSSYDDWRERQQHFVDPDYDQKPVGLLRRKVDNASDRVRPELLAGIVDRHAAHDAVFTSDTGMSTVWLSRFVRMSGTRRLVGSYNLGSMANAMPQALGAAGLDRDRQVIAFCGDGGLSMLMGDLITAVSHELPVKLVVFDNGRLGMVKLEMEQVGLPEFGTVLHNPDFAKVAEAVGMRGIRVEDPHDVEAGVLAMLDHPGPVLLDVLTNPDEIVIPPKPTLKQGWGFAIAKTREFVDSPE